MGNFRDLSVRQASYVSPFSPCPVPLIGLSVHDKFYRGKNRTDWSEDVATGDDDEEDPIHENVKLEKRYSAKTTATINLLDERLVPYELIVRLLERICFEDTEYGVYSSAILIFMPGMGEIRRLNDMLMEHPSFGDNNFRIYPLHSTLSSENQAAVFDIPPAHIRKIVIGQGFFRPDLSEFYISFTVSHKYCGDGDHHTRHYMRD